MVVRKHQVVTSHLVVEVVMRGVMDNLERGGVRHKLVMGLQMSDVMVNMMNIVMDNRLGVEIALSLKREVGGRKGLMMRMVDYWVNSVTGVDHGLVTAVMEVMMAHTHVNGVRVNEWDIVMEEVVQLMMKGDRVKGVVMGHGHDGSRRGRGKMARYEEVINVLDLSGGLGSGHTIGGEGDHGVG